VSADIRQKVCLKKKAPSTLLFSWKNHDFLRLWTLDFRKDLVRERDIVIVYMDINV